MSETTTEQNQPTEPDASTEQQGDPAAASEESRPPRHVPVAELAEERSRRKKVEERLAELERANETEAQRLQREAQEAREALPKGITEAFREAAVTFGGISEEDAELFLTGSDKETLQKQAARLMERTPTGPLPDPSQGASGSKKPRSVADEFAEWSEATFS